MGSSGNDNAAKQAQYNEEERQRQIAKSTGRINAIFSDPARTGQYDRLAADTTAFLTDDLNRQKQANDRQLKFAMARSGQHGGSVSADANRTLGESYLRGIVEAQRRGNAAGADLRMADEQARSNMLAMAQSGLDATTAASQSANMLRGNLQSAQAGSTANGIAGFFDQFSDTYRKSQDAAERRRGERWAYNTIYQPGFGYGGNG